MSAAVNASTYAEVVSSDLRIIDLCNRLVKNNAELMALHKTRRTIEDEVRTEADLIHLQRMRSQLLDELNREPEPNSMSAARAMASVSLAITDTIDCPEHRLAISVCKLVIRQASGEARLDVSGRAKPRAGGATFYRTSTDKKRQNSDMIWTDGRLMVTTGKG